MTAEKAYAEAHRTAPLQFYGGFASGIRPDLVTIDNLEAIITGLKTDGFAFTTVSELCGLSGAR